MLARWLPASSISQKYAVHEAALFRYSQRGMLGARWDEASATWLFDVLRVRDLFLQREAARAAPASSSFGVLGDVRLAGAGPQRRNDARDARLPLHVGAPPAEIEPQRLTRAS